MRLEPPLSVPNPADASRPSLSRWTGALFCVQRISRSSESGRPKEAGSHQ